MKLLNQVLYFKVIAVLIAIFAPHAEVGAQSVSVLQHSDRSDSSYYDAEQIATNEYWLVGKKGIISSTKDCKHFAAVNYPNKGVNILRIARFSKNHILLCADSGYIYHYYKKPGCWDVLRVKGYENKVFYNCAIVNDSVAYICGGNSAISQARIAIPGGFILKTKDKGITWKEIHSAPGSMFWDIDFDGKNIVAVKYNVVGSRLLTFDIDNDSIVKRSQLYSMLIHENLPGEALMAGGKNFNYKRNGCITTSVNAVNPMFQTIGMIWDVEAVGHQIVASGSKGVVMIFDEMKGVFDKLNSVGEYNLYDILPINETKALMVGSNKTIVEVDLKPAGADKSNSMSIPLTTNNHK